MLFRSYMIYHRLLVSESRRLVFACFLLTFLLPIYYRNKIYSEEEREALFLSKVEKGIVWICGEKCLIDDYSSYINLLEYHRNRASKLYHDNPQDWEEAKYLRRLERQRNTRKKTMRKKASAARVQQYSRLQGNLFGFHTFPLGV